jgi:hypothetical protein
MSKTFSIPFVLCAAIGCSSHSATRLAPDSVAACSCSPAAECREAACVCPNTFVTATSPALGAQMISAPAGYWAGVVGVTGSDGLPHSVIVTASQTAQTGAPLDIGESVFVAVGYDVESATSVRSMYSATTGAVTLSRLCAGGVAGVMNDVSLVEIDATSFKPIANGCTTTVATLKFNIGGTCP